MIDKTNRQGSLFLCGKCGYIGNADHIGALNLVGRVVKECFVPILTGGG